MQRNKCLHNLGGARGARNYLKFTALEPSTIALVKVGNPMDISLQTSLNGAPWQTYTTGNTITLNEGDELRWKATTVNSATASNTSNYHNYVMTGSIAADGDLQSLIDSTLHNRLAARMSNLFKDCTSLKTPPYSSATRFTANGAYSHLFYGSGIRSAMRIVVDLIDARAFEYCYSRCANLVDASMMDCSAMRGGGSIPYIWIFDNAFCDCTALVQPPKITINDNSTELYYTFNSAFSGCTSLVDASNIVILDAAIGGRAFNAAFNGCTSLQIPPSFRHLVRTSTYGREFYSAFENCTSLVNAPTIDCDANFQRAFSGCTSLVDASGVTLGNYADNASSRSFYGCTSLQIPPTIKCQDNGIAAFSETFRGCTSLLSAEIEDFTGATWATQQFERMFYGCTSLQRLKVHFEQWGDGVNGTTNWLQNAASAATFECPATLDQTQRDNSHIPSGWTIETF